MECAGKAQRRRRFRMTRGIWQPDPVREKDGSPADDRLRLGGRHLSFVSLSSVAKFLNPFLGLGQAGSGMFLPVTFDGGNFLLRVAG